VFKIVLTEETDRYFLFCTREIFPFKHISAASSTGRFHDSGVNSKRSSTQPAHGCEATEYATSPTGPRRAPRLGPSRGARCGFHATPAPHAGNRCSWAAPALPGTGLLVTHSQNLGDTVLQAGPSCVSPLFSL